jgi:bifunctional non-homologous end joining protein LigD
MEKLTRVSFTNLGKVLYPESGITKGKVIEYYMRAAPRMLPYLRDRPLVLRRYPDGVESGGFYEHDAARGPPEWVRVFHRYSESSEREVGYVVCDDLDTLLWLANLAALELHIPLSRADDLDKPDMVLFDLDPQLPATAADATEVARLLHDRLDSLGLKAYVKTSGKRGLHVVVPIQRRHTFAETKGFARMVGGEAAARSAKAVTERTEKAPGKVLIDYPQNSRGHTMACPYTLRAVEGAPVSAPLRWDELGKVEPVGLNIGTVLRRRRDPWEGFWESPPRLPSLASG